MQTIDLYKKCSEINDLLNNNQKADARSEVIKLLDYLHGDYKAYTPFLNHLIREVGLYPYINEHSACWEDRFAYEAFKVDVGNTSDCILHIEQSEVLKRLLAGENLAVSAPTSFGKSFIIDAFIAIKKPNIVVIIVPTIALADETRRRLQCKFSNLYKIITTSDSVIADKTICVFPQERAFAYMETLSDIDILIVDEFYKASSSFGDSRCDTLLSAMIELGKKAKQKYYLAPNINVIKDNVFTESMTFLPIDFKTVVTKALPLYKQKPYGMSSDEFKKRELKRIYDRHIGKTLVYAGSYGNIHKVCTVLLETIGERKDILLHNFASWLEVNYGKEFPLIPLVLRGIGIHNGQLHRSLSQLQIKLFEEKEGLNTIVSTSSIIEGVNTQAENVILWSNKNGSAKIDYFTYRNIIGRAGRMFRYFIGKVYVLSAPPEKAETSLSLDFPDEVVKGLDGSNPGVHLENEQYHLIKSFNDDMISLLEEEKWKQLEHLPQIKICSPSFLKELVVKIKNNPSWPRNYECLIKYNTWDWTPALNDIIEFADIQKNDRNRLRTYACIACNVWNSSIKEIYEKVCRYEISYENMFAYERKVSFELASVISVINSIKLVIYPNSPDISSFVHRVTNAFLPKIVFQLEEYGLPRMISKKVQNTGLINLEDDTKEINAVINEFLNVGVDKLVSSMKNLLPFDLYIINYFYDGIIPMNNRI